MTERHIDLLEKMGESDLEEATDVQSSDVERDLLLGDVLEFVAERFPGNGEMLVALEACLSAASALCISNVTGCPAILLEGKSSSGKTTVLRMLDRQLEGIVYFTDHFTPASFVSHKADVSEEQLQKIDLLPKIKGKVMVVPDVGVTLSDRKDKLTENLGVLTRILDGQGYQTDSGAKGRRGYEGDYKFAFLGATTPLSDHAWQEMSKIGTRLLVLDMGGHEPTVDELADMVTSPTDFEVRVNECKQVVRKFLEALWRRTGGYAKVSWNSQSSFDKAFATVIAGYAKLTAQLRGRATGLGESEESNVQIESPIRLMTALMNVARGHALASGRETLDVEDAVSALVLALDTCPKARRLAIRMLLSSPDGRATTQDIAGAVHCADGTALKIMREFVALGVAVWSSDSQRSDTFEGRQKPKSITVASEHARLVSSDG